VVGVRYHAFRFLEAQHCAVILFHLHNLPEPLEVKYIELWNEPDVPAGYDTITYTVPTFYGCWTVRPGSGTPPPYNEAGIYYAKVLNTVAPYVKAQLPTMGVQFVAPAAAEVNTIFVDRVLNDAMNNIDVFSYHRYVNSYNESCNVPSALATQESSFAHARSDLNSHGGTAVPILISEGAMKHPITNTPSTLFYNCQASYARSLISWLRNKEGTGNLKGFIWYTIGFNGWQSSDLLLNASGTPKPVYYAWRDWGPVSGAPLIVRNYAIPTPQSRGMSDFGQSDQIGAYPPPLDGSAPGIDQPLDQNGQVPYPAPDLTEDAAFNAEPSLDQNNQVPYPAPDLAEDAAPTEEPSLDQNTPLPPPIPSPVETPTPGVDPTLDQATPTPASMPVP
jgi:hypothetical protein